MTICLIGPLGSSLRLLTLTRLSNTQASVARFYDFISRFMKSIASSAPCATMVGKLDLFSLSIHHFWLLLTTPPCFRFNSIAITCVGNATNTSGTPDWTPINRARRFCFQLFVYISLLTWKAGILLAFSHWNSAICSASSVGKLL